MLRSEFTEDFVRFVEQKLLLRIEPAWALRVIAGPLPAVRAPLAMMKPRAPYTARPGESRDCDESQPQTVSPVTSFRLPNSSRLLECSIAYGPQSANWTTLYTAINREFQQEWRGLRWASFATEGEGLDPLLTAAIQTGTDENLKTPFWLVAPPRAAESFRAPEREESIPESCCGVIVLWKTRPDGEATDPV